MATVPGTSFPFASVTVNVSKFPTADELIVSGSIGWLKVAVAAVPVTRLPLVFMLVGTFVALLPGLDEITIGSVAAPIRVPGATVEPGSTAATTLPIPPPAIKATNNNAINIVGLYELSNLVIFFPCSHGPTRHAVLGDRLLRHQVETASPILRLGQEKNCSNVTTCGNYLPSSHAVYQPASQRRNRRDRRSKDMGIEAYQVERQASEFMIVSNKRLPKLAPSVRLPFRE
jgi:hypothetical protein